MSHSPLQESTNRSGAKFRESSVRSYLHVYSGHKLHTKVITQPQSSRKKGKEQTKRSQGGAKERGPRPIERSPPENRSAKVTMPWPHVNKTGLAQHTLFHGSCTHYISIKVSPNMRWLLLATFVQPGGRGEGSCLVACRLDQDVEEWKIANRH